MFYEFEGGEIVVDTEQINYEVVWDALELKKNQRG